MAEPTEPSAGKPPGALRRAFDWVFRSRETGKIVIVQALNLPLGIFFVAAAVRRFAGLEGAARTVVEVVATGSLLWWAADEVLRGVNPFRRLLGAVVGTATIAGAVMTWGLFR